jgi:hypothetical protein
MTATFQLLLHRCWPSTTYHRQLHANRDPDVYASRCSGGKNTDRTKWQVVFNYSEALLTTESWTILQKASLLWLLTLHCNVKKYCDHGLNSVHLTVLPQEVQNRQLVTHIR